ncbi:MAG: 3'(2'),5'-bisphosphate nucleotidase CysQ [Pseudomonadota bacterium]
MGPNPALPIHPLAADLLAERDLLVEAAEAAGALALPFFHGSVQSWEKEDDAGPVSEADMAVNSALETHLLGARPGYGWLSEESEDGAARLAAERVFIVDPIDGTRAFLKGETGFAVAVALVEAGRVIASTVHLPARGETYAAALGAGATLNGEPIAPSPRHELEGATALGAKASYRAEHWPGGAPPVERIFRHALEWRLCMIADGSFDLMVTMRDAFEWDVAAGALIASEAGARITDRDGEELRFNAAFPKVPGVIVAPPALHQALMALRLG